MIPVACFISSSHRYGQLKAVVLYLACMTQSGKNSSELAGCLTPKADKLQYLLVGGTNVGAVIRLGPRSAQYAH